MRGADGVRTDDLRITMEWFERRRERDAFDEFCAAFSEICHNASGGSGSFSEESDAPSLQDAEAHLDTLAQTWDTDFSSIKKAWRPLPAFQRAFGASFTPPIPLSRSSAPLAKSSRRRHPHPI